MTEERKCATDKQPQDRSLDMTFMSQLGEDSEIKKLKEEICDLKQQLKVIRRILEVIQARQGSEQRERAKWVWHMYGRVQVMYVNINLLKGLLQEVIKAKLVQPESQLQVSYIKPEADAAEWAAIRLESASCPKFAFFSKAKAKFGELDKNVVRTTQGKLTLFGKAAALSRPTTFGAAAETNVMREMFDESKQT